VLVAAFRGWNDGAQGASLAASFLAQAWNAERFADIDPEDFFDFQAVRPQVALEDGLTRRIDWPENAFFRASIPNADRDAILLLGVEPNTHWRTFTGEIVELTRDLGVELVVTLGALLADVPHTRPAPVTGSASDPKLVDELGLAASRYEGPTGIVGVLHDGCRRSGLPSASLWAAVPHYASLVSSPKAAHALCVRLGSLLDVELDLADLERASEALGARPLSPEMSLSLALSAADVLRSGSGILVNSSRAVISSVGAVTIAAAGRQLAERPHHPHHGAKQAEHGSALDHGVHPGQTVLQIAQHVALEAVAQQAADLGVADVAVGQGQHHQLGHGPVVAAAKLEGTVEIPGGKVLLQAVEKFGLLLLAAEPGLRYPAPHDNDAERPPKGNQGQGPINHVTYDFRDRGHVHGLFGFRVLEGLACCSSAG